MRKLISSLFIVMALLSCAEVVESTTRSSDESNLLMAEAFIDAFYSFDPLELDRYSTIQQLSRALAESASDMVSLKDLLQSVTSDAETLLVQQARVTAELQDGLMRTRMVPFQRHVPRLTRLVRQVATEVGKRAELAVEGASGELEMEWS